MLDFNLGVVGRDNHCARVLARTETRTSIIPFWLDVFLPFRSRSGGLGGVCFGEIGGGLRD